MKTYIKLAILLALVSCGAKESATIYNGTDGQSCSVGPALDEESHEVVGALITCADSTQVVLNGADGQNGAEGAQGIQGRPGNSCSVHRSWFGNFSTIYCPGSLPVIVRDGRDGEDGEDGRDGRNGRDGASCSIRDTSNGALITCGSNSVAILDGERGPQGLAAPTVIGISAYIRPCGNEFANDEIFLRMSDNNILALYDGGPHEDRLVLLAPGNYITTDRNRNNTCNFTVTQSLEITNQRVQ
jgi:hypothetical protein